MDYRSLIFPRLAILPTAAINLHATRTANERQGSADLIGAAGNPFFFLTLGFVVISTAWKLNIYSHDDTTGEFGTDDHAHTVGHVEFPAGSQSFVSDTSFDPDSGGLGGCSVISTPDGYTLTTYDLTGGGTTDDPPASPVVEIRLDSDDSLIGLWTGLVECDMFDIGPARAWGYKPQAQ